MAKGQCCTCKVELTKDNCYPSVLKNKKGYCRVCDDISSREYYKINSKKMGLKHKEYYKINSKKIGLWYVEYCKNNKERLHTIAKTYKTTIKGRHTYLRQRLKKENIPQTDLLWSLNFYTEIIRDLTCHYCGGILNPFGHALDCADAGKGHVCYNVVPCCRSCNTKKMNDTSYEEMMLLAPVLREIRLRREARQEI